MEPSFDVHKKSLRRMDKRTAGQRQSCLDLIHISMKFHQNIPYGYLVLACTRKVYAEWTNGQLNNAIASYVCFFQNRRIKLRLIHVSSPKITIFTLNTGTPKLLTMLLLKFEQAHFITFCWVWVQLGEWQTVQTLIRCHILQHLIWAYTVC